MTTLLLLPLLTFVAAHNDDNNSCKKCASNYTRIINDGIDFTTPYENWLLTQHKKQQLSRRTREMKMIRVLNGTELIMECQPAEYLVQTHMAPDFENPQLVRKLNWFHEGSLIASFQQVYLKKNK